MLLSDVALAAAVYTWLKMSSLTSPGATATSGAGGTSGPGGTRATGAADGARGTTKSGRPRTTAKR